MQPVLTPVAANSVGTTAPTADANTASDIYLDRRHPKRKSGDYRRSPSLPFQPPAHDRNTYRHSGIHRPSDPDAATNPSRSDGDTLGKLRYANPVALSTLRHVAPRTGVNPCATAHSAYFAAAPTGQHD